jgi:hypothetical protein
VFDQQDHQFSAEEHDRSRDQFYAEVHDRSRDLSSSAEPDLSVVQVLGRSSPHRGPAEASS